MIVQNKPVFLFDKSNGMFVGKDRSLPSGSPQKHRLLALLANIRSCQKGLPGSNNVAYYKHS
jgi:hypothetical protein